MFYYVYGGIFVFTECLNDALCRAGHSSRYGSYDRFESQFCNRGQSGHSEVGDEDCRTGTAAYNSIVHRFPAYSPALGRAYADWCKLNWCH